MGGRTASCLPNSAFVACCLDPGVTGPPLWQPGPRKWASWEAPWYFSMGSAFVVLYFGLAAKPNTDLRTWARQQALAMEEEE